MDKVLNVYWEQTLVGRYHQKHGKNFFSYDRQYLDTSDARPISIALPLQTEEFNAQTTHNFFSAILPEDQQRILIARNLGVSAGNDYSLLEKIGGECAGALSIFPADKVLDTEPPQYKELAADKLANILSSLPSRPLLIGIDDIRMSLAGVQDKFAVAIDHKTMLLPMDGAPTTHIIKPEILGYEISTVVNEAFCLKLAKAINLPVAECEIRTADAIKYLLVTRYDRQILDTNTLSIKRLHQEDFCQALNIPSEHKYQNEGGPSLHNCIDLLRNVTVNKVQSLKVILDAVIFNYIVGNCDAHGKNFSLLYIDPEPTFAPLYDILCTRIYTQLSSKMAMKIGREYNLDKVSASDFTKFAQQSGLNQHLILERIQQLANVVLATVADIKLPYPDADIISNFIGERASRITKINNS